MVPEHRIAAHDGNHFILIDLSLIQYFQNRSLKIQRRDLFYFPARFRLDMATRDDSFLEIHESMNGTVPFGPCLISGQGSDSRYFASGMQFVERPWLD